MLTYRHRIGLITFTSLALILVAVCMAPFAQDQAYHAFLDGRTWLGIPNFGNVMSNLPFILVGICGVFIARARKSTLAGYYLWGVFFVGVLLTGFGSAYYHLAPDNGTLVWDRLPMAISFMSLFSLIIMERVHLKSGFVLFPVLLTAGVASVWYWHYTEMQGHGDLRPYILVQFLPLIIIPMILILFPTKQGGNKYLIYTLGWYILAKLFEYLDANIFNFTGNIMSGHSLKHFAAAIGAACVIKYMQTCNIEARQR